LESNGVFKQNNINKNRGNNNDNKNNSNNNNNNNNNNNKTERTHSNSTKKYLKWYYQTYQIKKKGAAIMNHTCDAGPIFGEGHDIYISNRCNKNESWCSLGKTYSSPYPYGSVKANK
jgi:hypothetical protein